MPPDPNAKAGCPMQNLQLDRPLVCFDLETTGTDVQRDRIVQIALIRLEPSGERRVFETLVNPGIKIPPAATAVHGIDDALVRDAPGFSVILPEVERMLDGADLSGFNVARFDLPLLEAEIVRHGGRVDLSRVRVIDAMTIFHRQEPRHLEAALRFYCDRELEGAHSALADAEATLAVLDAQLGRYPELPRDAGGLHAYCSEGNDRYLDRTRKLAWNDAGEAALSFGKHRGRTLRELVELDRQSGDSYLRWMVRDGDFSPEVKQIVLEALNGRLPSRP
jgi:DNA polymerase III subunit epsilon